MGLVSKLCEVMSAIDKIGKKGENKFHNYKYAQEADIVEAVRGELAKRQLFIFPNVVHNARTGDITDIMVEWTFVDGESGETHTCAIPGAGQDKGDKGVYKALTGSEKYFLMKAFLIPTGDDPEKDGAEDREKAKEAARVIGEAKVANLQQKAVAKPINTPPPPPAAKAPVDPKDVDQLAGVFVSAKMQQTKDKRDYMAVEIADVFGSPIKISAFDNFVLFEGDRLFDALKAAKPEDVFRATVVAKEVKGKTYYNLIDLMQLGSAIYDKEDLVPVLTKSLEQAERLPF